MKRLQPTSFEDWVEFCFRGRPTSEFWFIDLEDDEVPWLGRDDVLSVDYFTRLHENGVEVLNAFSNEEIGAGLWALYSSASELCPAFHVVPRDDLHRAIRSVGIFVSQTLPVRLTPGSEDPPHDALYMFWDIVPIWPHRVGPFEAEDRAVCIDEMAACLEVEHPTARYHALHGLGHFELTESGRCTQVIDQWLATSPLLDTKLRDYAVRARRAYIQ